jgi:hypothetical protein
LDEKADYRVVAVITHGSVDARLLVERQAGEWRLPLFTLPGLEDSRALAPDLRAAVAERFGFAVVVLCVLRAKGDDPARAREALLAVDAGSLSPRSYVPATPYSGAAGESAWLMAGELGGLRFTDEAEAALVRAWLADLRPGGGHPLRLAWTRPGWMAEAHAWIEAELAAQGLRLAGPIEQQRTWSLSVLLRAPLAPPAAGSAYFKALPPLFAAEPRITQALARRFPTLVPDVIALDEARGWLLLRGFAGPLLQHSADLAVWAQALRGYARLQAATASEPEALFAAGCADRRLGRLPSDFAAVLADPEHLRLDQPGGLTAAQLAELEAVAAVLPAACAALEACGLPNTLEHGDIHGNNIAITPSGFVYFDWSDGCLAHPFVCLTTFLENVRPEWHAPLTAAYLEEWRAWASPAQLQQALRLAQPLGAAHLAVSYHRILAATEPGQRWQLAGALPFFLRETLRLRAGLGAQSGQAPADA